MTARERSLGDNNTLVLRPHENQASPQQVRQQRLLLNAHSLTMIIYIMAWPPVTATLANLHDAHMRLWDASPPHFRTYKWHIWRPVAPRAVRPRSPRGMPQTRTETGNVILGQLPATKKNTKKHQHTKIPKKTLVGKTTSTKNINKKTPARGEKNRCRHHGNKTCIYTHHNAKAYVCMHGFLHLIFTLMHVFFLLLALPRDTGPCTRNNYKQCLLHSKNVCQSIAFPPSETDRSSEWHNNWHGWTREFRCVFCVQVLTFRSEFAAPSIEFGPAHCIITLEPMGATNFELESRPTQIQTAEKKLGDWSSMNDEVWNMYRHDLTELSVVERFYVNGTCAQARPADRHAGQNQKSCTLTFGFGLHAGQRP